MPDTFPKELRYSREDEWTRASGNRVVIGITDYAQEQLGDIVFVELPEIGKVVDQGDPFGVIESVKAVSDLYAPVSGEVVEANESLREQPESVNEDCYGEGWMIAISVADSSELEQLLDSKAYAQHVKERAD